jgi:phosphatidylglycerol lysyltransferase
MSGVAGQADRERVLALVRRHGWNATSFQVLEPEFRYLLVDEDACVAYVDTGRAWVAAGAPLADETRMRDVATAFVTAARAAGRRASFFATEARFTSLCRFRSLLVGEQGVWDPTHWDHVLRRSRGLREQLRRARAKGVRVRAVDLQQTGIWGQPLRSAIAGLVDRWLRGRELAPMGFLAQVEPMALQPYRRLLIAERDGALVGLLSIAPVCGRRGWLLQNLVRDPTAPNGTAEALIDRAMRIADDEGLRFVTFGLAPLAGDVKAPLRFARIVGTSTTSTACGRSRPSYAPRDGIASTCRSRMIRRQCAPFSTSCRRSPAAACSALACARFSAVPPSS